jgi:hypothetical protein
MMVDNKTRVDIGYEYMHIWVVSRFISGYKDITGQHWLEPCNYGIAGN